MFAVYSCDRSADGRQAIQPYVWLWLGGSALQPSVLRVQRQPQCPAHDALRPVSRDDRRHAIWPPPAAHGPLQRGLQVFSAGPGLPSRAIPAPHRDEIQTLLEGPAWRLILWWCGCWWAVTGRSHGRHQSLISAFINSSLSSSCRSVSVNESSDCMARCR